MININSYRFVDMTSTFKMSVSVTDSQLFTLGTFAAYNFWIDWGDTTTELITTANPQHTYTTAGTYQIEIYGTLERFYFNNSTSAPSVISIDQWGDIGLTSDQTGAFFGCALTSIASDNLGLNFLNNTLTVATNMFRDTLLTTIDSSITFASLVTGNYLFSGSTITAISCVFPALVTGNYMFYNCSDFASLPNATFPLLENGTDMFRNCPLLTSVPSSTFPSLTNGFYMFTASGLSSIAAGTTFALVTDGRYMFYDTDLVTLPSSVTFAALTNALGMFQNSNSITGMPSAVTFSLVTNGNSTFKNCNAFTDFPSANFAALSVGNDMFAGATLNTTDYDNILSNIAANNINTSVTFSGGSSLYTNKTDRDYITGTLLWIVTDGGYDGELMSFQTDINGTFSPVLTLSSGTLRWNIDGTDYTTNSPSVALTGSTVDVKIYANGVSENQGVTNINFASQQIIGTLDFSYFTLSNSNIDTYINAGLTAITFSTNANTAANVRVYNCNLSSLDLSNVTFSGLCYITNNASLSTISFASGSTSTGFSATSCNFSSIDFTNVTMSGICYLGTNTSLSSVTFASGTTSTDLRANGCNFTSLDFSNVTFNGKLHIYSNTGLTSVTFSTNANVITDFKAYSCNLSSLDLSNVTFSVSIEVYSNSALSTITQGSYTTGFILYDAIGCALGLTSVDSIFSSLNTFFSANTPVNDLDVSTEGGTNSAPTGGSSNTDIVNLLSVFSGAGQTFTYSIN